MIHVSISPEILFHPFGFPITNTLLTAWIVMAFLVVVSFFISRAMRNPESKLRNLAEAVVETLVDFLETIAGSRQKVIRFFPIVATIFFFVLFANWFGIFPGVGSIGFTHEDHGHTTFAPLLRSVNSDLNMTLALALIVVTLTHIFGLTVLGIKGHLGKFFNFHSGVGFFMGILELVGEVARIISFSFRLFGNIFAGEVLLMIITFLVPYLAPVPFFAMEVFVGLIQAVIFAVLSMMFLVAATESHGEHHEKKEGEHVGAHS